jgi:hypothetical protein
VSAEGLGGEAPGDRRGAAAGIAFGGEEGGATVSGPAGSGERLRLFAQRLKMAKSAL